MKQFLQIAGFVAGIAAGTAGFCTVVVLVANAGPQATAPKPALTVQQYLDQPTTRQAAWTRCADDPGHTQHDPACTNARAAERIATSGSGRFPRIVP